SSRTTRRRRSSPGASCTWRKGSCSSRRARPEGRDRPRHPGPRPDATAHRGLAMTKSGFVIANLFRKRTRTILTLLSVITALLMFSIDPLRHHDIYPEYVMPEAEWQAFANTRSGIIAGKMVAEQYGWKLGQKIPISSKIFPQKNGSKAWSFDLVGIFDGKD